MSLTTVEKPSDPDTAGSSVQVQAQQSQQLKRRVPKPAPNAQKKRKPGLSAWISTIVLIALLVIVCFPVYYLVIGSVMKPADLVAYPSVLWPQSGISLSNFGDAFNAIPLLRQYGNSIVTAGIITIAQLLTSVLAAYAFVFLPLKRPRLWFGIFLATMMIPAEATIIPNYLTLADAGLIDTYAAIALPFLATGFGTFLIRQSFLSFPLELRDAAMMDGAGSLRFLFTILLPISKPTLAAVGLYSFMSAWNMYLWPLLVTRSPEMQTVQIGLTQLKSPEAYDPGMIMAGTLLVVAPTLIILIFGQKYIVKGLTAGSIK